VDAKLPGPENTFKKGKPETSIDFKVYIDPVNPVAKISIQDQEFILKEGEWSGWKKISYGLIPTQSVSAICMFYLKEVRPGFKLYVSPINIDPSNPALPISTPSSYAKDLEKKFGFFYTQGLPADYAALSNDVLDEEEFLYQEDIVLQERREMYEYELSNFDSGLFFYYVSSTDQRQHMFWRLLDKSHPTYDEKQASKFGDTIEKIYRTADEILDKAMQKADKDTIIMAMSDHGFTTFRREVNLNTWLKKSGYLHLINDTREGENEFFLNTDWARTRAYAMGLNSLYINERGRESEGIVSKGEEKESLVREIAKKLEEFQDPETGERPILKASVAKDILQGPLVDTAPDIFIGYNRGYRASWATPLGNAPEGITKDNMDKWSGTHCIAPEITPGIFFTNRKIKAQSPALYDLTATILNTFNIDIPEDMLGKPVF
jgi:predicted AlkP superfamily phosphohydrolase/phosphomutase